MMVSVSMQEHLLQEWSKWKIPQYVLSFSKHPFKLGSLVLSLQFPLFLFNLGFPEQLVF